ncbi:MAG: glucose-6-phosphate isomerase [Rhodobacteraceae bacterium]|nr:glucose-6-phosphate isomerase [Paracoccaceae bacterium]
MTGIWQELFQNREKTQSRPLLSLFEDKGRFAAFSAQADTLLLDFSKTSIDRLALALLVALAEENQVAAHRDAMFRGDPINSTENRAVLHTALRAGDAAAPLVVNGQDLRPQIAQTLRQMEDFAHGIRTGRVAAAGGEPFRDVVNIGIGGSDLGPAMATAALAPYHTGPRCHFVSNVDGAHIHDTLRGLDARTTLIIVASKTFTTLETMTNARTALAWLRKSLGDSAPAHLVAVSSAPDKTRAMGIAPDRVFGFADWVGGRYSLWGPVGLSLMLAIGPEHFRALLGGARAMDAHFQTAPLRRNLPVLLGLVGVWHRNICGYGSRALLPYDQRLARLPAYVQQLDMESNGKGVQASGAAVAQATGPVVWGEPGTNGQHAFFQLLHQGSEIIPCEFLIAARGHEPDLQAHHQVLQANCLGQSEALMRGRSLQDALEIAAQLGYKGQAQRRQAAHRVFAGNRPSITLAYPQLTPFTLGQIIALYEHRIFVEGTIWGINSFDQWGVELGKELSTALLPQLQKGAAGIGADGSTAGLIAKLAGQP